MPKGKRVQLASITLRCSKDTRDRIDKVVEIERKEEPDRSYSVSMFIRDAVREKLRREEDKR